MFDDTHPSGPAEDSDSRREHDPDEPDGEDREESGSSPATPFSPDKDDKTPLGDTDQHSDA